MCVLLRPKMRDSCDRELLDWLAGVPELDAERVPRWKELFSKHSVDAALLDALASAIGASILCAWRRHPLQPLRAVPHPCGAESLDGDDSPDAAVLEDGGAAADAPRRLGRQKIPAADRRSGAHYFATATSRSPAATCVSPPPRIAARAESHRAAAARAAAPPTPEKVRRAQAAQSAPPTPEGQRSAQKLEGVLRSFNQEKGYGFITSGQCDGDVFVRGADLPDDCEAGQPLHFELFFNSRGQQQARHVARRELQRFVGVLKSLGEEYGFISCPEAHALAGRDVYVARGQLPLEVLEDPAEAISFEVAFNAKGQPQARDVEVEPGAGGGPDEALAASAVDGRCASRPVERRVRW